jgi:hypothetical protein
MFICCTDVHQVLNEFLCLIGELRTEANRYVTVRATTYVLLSISVTFRPWECQGRWSFLFLWSPLPNLSIISIISFAVFVFSWSPILERWNRRFESHSRHGCLYSVRLICVCVQCVGRGLVTGWSLVQGVLPTVYRIKKLKNRQGPTKGCRAIDTCFLDLPTWWSGVGRSIWNSTLLWDFRVLTTVKKMTDFWDVTLKLSLWRTMKAHRVVRRRGSHIFYTIGTQMAVRLSALRACRPLPPGRFLVLISVRRWIDPRAIVRLEGLGQLKNPMTSSGNEPVTFRLVE